MAPRTPDSEANIDQCCVNVIRTLSMDAVQKANSGHPGAPMGLAPAGYVLWTRVMKHNPRNPDWPDRDRFVLSGGHASMLLYSLLYLTGYDLSLDDIKQFRQWGSRTPGHPEYAHTPGVETTTGPLGQGFANAVGMAMAERHMAARFNQPDHPVVDHYTYVMCGDGDLMEGVAAEAASLAGHLGLGRLICIYDDNDISIEGSTDIAFTEDVAQRFSAYNWHVLTVSDGNDLAAIEEALQAARAETERPSMIVLRTQIAYGSPNKQGSADAHGAPLGVEEVCLAKDFLGCDKDQHFCVPADALAHCRQTAERGQAAEEQWRTLHAAYAKAHPELADQWVNAVTHFLPRDWEKDLVAFAPSDGAVATRAASGKALNALAERIPTLMGGSADLAPSNNTFLKGLPEFQKGSYHGRNIRFGVREHAMGAIMSGLFLHGGIRPYGGTFLVFADYVRPAIRVAALMGLPLIYVFTHDSVAVGEDGPTHQPVEHLASLRAIPNLTVLRPCDANETVDAWIQAIRSTNSPVVVALSRQNLPVLERSQTNGQLVRGGYVLSDCQGAPDILLIATGAEVHLALAAQTELAQKKIAARVINMPSWELFEKNSDTYKNEVLPPAVTARLAIEAGIEMGWQRYVGVAGKVIGINTFGASAPGATVLEKYGFTVANVVAQAEQLLNG
ncbi:transketolase [Desulfatitalea alkaliphila]|uniref:Transketolase n=1 Tax=Desulfatitalea alkaliphila TaxID=2929485 RepID=A0AA41UHQ6_9BACT|nr:transketolase [Desulfatitalea alkaliphila]MCJ8499875.1 transketolase [Desulfatitalea alkaliphila]